MDHFLNYIAAAVSCIIQEEKNPKTSKLPCTDRQIDSSLISLFFETKVFTTTTIN